MFEHECREKYVLEEQSKIIYEQEEMRWQRKCREQWLLEGDSNTSFSMEEQMGDRGRAFFFSLQKGEESLTDFKDFQEHLYEYYKELFGKGV